jgi:hypothetical protein
MDPDGRVLFRSDPHAGFGLATAHSNSLTVLPDSACIVSGGPGIVAYESDARCRWVWADGCSNYDYDEKRDLLVASSWARKTGEQMNVQIQCVNGLGSEPG